MADTICNMKRMITVTTILPILLLLQAACASPKWVEISELRPTQMTIGIVAMRDKIKKIESKDQRGKLKKYLIKKSAPAIIGPDKKYYITDRHHTSRAVLESRVESKKFVVDIKDDWSDMSFSQFYQNMIKRGYLYLYYMGEGPLDPEKLPKSIGEIEDDPYRSLSWMVREEGGYKKVNVSYLEFLWADYLRKKINMRLGDEIELKKVLPLALKAVRSKDAAHLPGYLGQK